MNVSTAIRNAWLDAVKNAIDAGPGPGKLNFYNGSKPTTGGAVTTLLGTVTCSDPCAPSASSGVLTFSAFTDDANADATGTATWARFTDSTGAFVCDVTVGLSGADIIMSSVSIVAGGTIKVSSGMLTAGNS